MGLDDAITRNLELEGSLVARAISVGLDWLAEALDQETAIRVRLGVLERAHAALLALETDEEELELAGAEPPSFKLALVEQVPLELEPAPPPPPPGLTDASDDDLENEVLRRLRERGQVIA